MSLVLDRRQGGRPGLHALLCGVSHYVHLPAGGGERAERTFGLQQLSSTATTVWRFYQWLLAADREGRLPLPLATVQLLLAPAAAELEAEPAMGQAGAGLPTRRGFVGAARAWRQAASASDDEMTMFYFAGHGVQRQQKDSVLLLHDFGDPGIGGPLVNAIDVRQLVAGMAPPRNPARRIARRQLYFVDACRMPVGDFQQHEWQNVPDLWVVELNGLDDRAAPVFFASVPGASAFATAGDQTLFSQALFECLDRLGARSPRADDPDPRYRVTTLSLISALSQAIEAVNAEHRAEQTFAPDGQQRDVPIVFHDRPPEVDVRVSVDPDLAAPRLRLEVADRLGQPSHAVDDPAVHPWDFRLPAGLYTFSARLRSEPDPPFRATSQLEKVELPRAPVTLRVGP